MKQRKILIIEDDPKLGQSLIKGLLQNNFDSILLTDGLQAKIFDFEKDKVDLVILDWNIPYFDGIEVLRHWRRTKGISQIIPVIMLTARGAINDKIQGFDFGADDYVCKVFEWEELIARIKALLKRSVIINEKTEFKHLLFDYDNNSFKENNMFIDLTKTEKDILKYLYEKYPKTISKEEIIENIWNNKDSFPDSNVIERHIKSIRKKFKKDPIITIKGIGYKINNL
jgi:DNA-binding response OmpR family regulator